MGNKEAVLRRNLELYIPTAKVRALKLKNKNKPNVKSANKNEDQNRNY